MHDIDDDGDPDVIAIGRIGNASDVSVLRNDGAGSLAIAATVFVGEAVSSAGVLDVDGDGRLDVVLCGVDHLPVLIADTEGGFALVEPFVVGAFPVARSAFTVDWTGDGDDELLLVGVGVGVIEPILGGAAWLTIMVPGGDNSAIAPLLRDVDGDGLDDLVYLNVPTTAGGPRVTERRREPGAGFAWPRHYGRAEGLASPLLDAAAFADFDGDGRLDAVFGASSIAWMLLGSCGSAPCAADLDGSGAVDGADLGALLAMWGAVGPRAAAADLDGNGVVDGGDVGAILAAWGECAK
ncbi:MAG: FG-GAP-like repeat-containing protein [Phycisphaerales bacterium]